MKRAFTHGDGGRLDLVWLEMTILLPLFAVAIAVAIKALRGLMQ